MSRGSGSRGGGVAEPPWSAEPLAARHARASVRLVICILASCLLGVVTAVLLFSGITGIVALAAHEPKRPDGVAVIIIFVLATLTGWGCLAAWERRRSRGTRRPGLGRSVVRIVASCLLGALAAILAAVGVAGVVSLFGGTGGAGSDRGLGYVFVVAIWCGSGAWALLRSSRRARPGGQLAPSGTADPALAGDRRLAADSGAPADLPAVTELREAAGTRMAREPRRAGDISPGSYRAAALPATDAQVRYRERCSQLLAGRAAAGLCLLAACAAGLVAVGGPNGRGAGPAGALLLTVALIAVIYLLFVLIDLPNGIDIEAGQFAAGVRGVRPAGRLWRRISGPLEAVLSWEVHTPDQVPAHPRQRRASRPARRNVQSLGDLRLFSRRQYLRLVVDPAAVQARLPARIMVGHLFVEAARAGAVWDGVILIGTRHPARLAAALEQALPGRRQIGGTDG